MRFVRKAKIPTWLPVVRDDREKRPFDLPLDAFHVTTKRLVTGDYSFVGLRSIVAIERKSGLAEICSDLSGKNRPRFLRFLGRMSKYPVRIMLIEGNGPNDIFDAVDYRGGTTPLHRTVAYWLSKISVEYRIPTLFVGDPAMPGLIEQVFRDAYAAGVVYRDRGDTR